MAHCQTIRLILVLGSSMAIGFSSPSVATEKPEKSATANASPAQKKKAHRPQRGNASYYGKEFYGRKMADGTRMNPQSNIAASRTLPLGTKAEVTNLENGKSEIVEIRDRGPYVDGRIVDLTPKTAEKLGFIEDGVAPVVVEPIAVPKAENSSR
jgi:rare lipoprotein A